VNKIRTLGARQNVICLGLMPALQRTLVFRHVELGEVNRAIECHQTGGGKALNMAVALATLGTPTGVTGFNGGASGRFVAAYVRAHGVRPGFTSLAGTTRTCTTVIDATSGVSTELIEEAPTPDAATWDAFVKRNRRLAARSRLLAISGTLPPGVADDFYAPFVQVATATGVPVVIDSHGGGLLRTLPYGPLLVKLNVRELEKTWGTVCATEAAILGAAERLRAAGARWVWVTEGGKPAYLLGACGAVRFDLPAITVKNPIGSGDCAAAGFIHAWLANGGAVADAVRAGLGCGMANALTLVPAQFDPKQALRLASLIRTRRING
jgi:1-phosphofructokinase family hexose kinase